MKIAVVTGANGFIGSHLVRRLAQSGISVLAIDREGCNDRLPQSPLVRFIPCELKDIISLDESLFSNTEPDVFYHLAWQGVAPHYRDDFDMQIQNVEYSLNCVRFAARIKARNFVLPGSTMEYVYNESPIDENSRPTPQNAYGSAKVAARFLCAQLAKSLKLPFVYAVLTGIYGVGREDKNVIFYTIESLLKGERPSLTKLEQKWDFIHINDAVEALVAIGERGRDGAFYAIGNGDNLPLANYIHIIRDLIDPTLPLGVGDVHYSGGKLPNSSINNSALRADTGFSPQIPFKTGIAEVIEYYRKKLRG